MSLGNDEFWTWYRHYLDTPKWKKKARKVRERDKYKCRLCGKRGWIVHHKTYARVGHEWMRDLVTLCPDCHEKIHNGG